MRRKPLSLILAALATIGISLLFWGGPSANESVRVELVCITNVPGKGPEALLKITNLTPDLIICPNGYLESGHSRTELFVIPAGRGPRRVPVLWQRRDFSRFDFLMNRLQYEFAVAIRSPKYRVDPWFPLCRVSYSPEIQR